MSNFRKIKRHPVTGRLKIAVYMDNYFGTREYGIKFDGEDKVYTEDEAAKAIEAAKKVLINDTPKNRTAANAAANAAMKIKILNYGLKLLKDSMKPKPSKRISEIRKEMNDQKAELFFKYGINDKNISSIIAFLDEQSELRRTEEGR